MDFISEILNSTDIVLVSSIIFVIQFAKQFIKSIGYSLPNDIWKLIVFVMGIGASLLSFSLNGIIFTWPFFIKSAFVYASASSILYQTGKLGITQVTKKKEDTDDEISSNN
jgi:hypothetical protein